MLPFVATVHGKIVTNVVSGSADNPQVAAQLLKRFRLTDGGGYRKRFKTGEIELTEMPAQFAERLKRYLEKWREMAGFEPTYEGIQVMILRDQYFLTTLKMASRWQCPPVGHGARSDAPRTT